MSEKNDLIYSSNLSLYEFNKQAMNNIKIDPIEINKRCLAAAKDIHSRTKKRSFWMLLCRERYDFTIFNIFSNSSNKLESSLLECLSNRGTVLDITKREDSNYEIWIRDKETENNYVYYLFDYNDAIIEV